MDRRLFLEAFVSSVAALTSAPLRAASAPIWQPFRLMAVYYMHYFPWMAGLSYTFVHRTALDEYIQGCPGLESGRSRLISDYTPGIPNWQALIICAVRPEDILLVENAESQSPWLGHCYPDLDKSTELTRDASSISSFWSWFAPPAQAFTVLTGNPEPGRQKVRDLKLPKEDCNGFFDIEDTWFLLDKGIPEEFVKYSRVWTVSDIVPCNQGDEFWADGPSWQPRQLRIANAEADR